MTDKLKSLYYKLTEKAGVWGAVVLVIAVVVVGVAAWLLGYDPFVVVEKITDLIPNG